MFGKSGFLEVCFYVSPQYLCCGEPLKNHVSITRRMRVNGIHDSYISPRSQPLVTQFFEELRSFSIWNVMEDVKEQYEIHWVARTFPVL